MVLSIALHTALHFALVLFQYAHYIAVIVGTFCWTLLFVGALGSDLMTAVPQYDNDDDAAAADDDTNNIRVLCVCKRKLFKWC